MSDTGGGMWGSDAATRQRFDPSCGVMQVIDDRLRESLGVVLAWDPQAPGERWWEVDAARPQDKVRWRPLHGLDPLATAADRARMALDPPPDPVVTLRAELATVLQQNEERYRLDIERFTSEVAELRRELAERSAQLEAKLERVPAEPPLCHAEALARATDWADGRLSHTNVLQNAERSPDDRVATLALIAFADAQEVVKWSALAMALRDPYA
jgi:hypothetical protein